jgi:hypothetical protein
MLFGGTIESKQPSAGLPYLPNSAVNARNSFARKFSTMPSPDTDLINVLIFDFGAARRFLKQA